MVDDIPPTCKFYVPNPNELNKLELIITPSRESMWHGGKFKFAIDIPSDYKFVVNMSYYFFKLVFLIITKKLATEGALFDSYLSSQY